MQIPTDLVEWLKNEGDNNNNSFVRHMVHTLRRFNGLTQRQWAVVAEIRREQQQQGIDKPMTPMPESWKRMAVMFRMASGQIKSPTVRLDLCGSDHSIVFEPDSPYGPSLYVRRRTHPQRLVMIVNLKYNRIHWKGINKAALRDEYIQCLQEFNDNPIEIARAYSSKYGKCSFCARPLSDPRSTEVGYGPICATNYGLPWGE